MILQKKKTLVRDILNAKREKNTEERISALEKELAELKSAKQV